MPDEPASKTPDLICNPRDFPDGLACAVCNRIVAYGERYATQLLDPETPDGLPEIVQAVCEECGQRSPIAEDAWTGRALNRSESEIGPWLSQLRQRVDAVGEHDHEDVVTMEWDELSDLVDLARKLWFAEMASRHP